MNRNTIRLALAGVVAFYVVIGGMWAKDFFPLENFYAQEELQTRLIEEHGPAAFDSEEYRESRERERAYALSQPDIFATVARVSLLQTILMWGTIGLAVAGGVLVLTRRKAGTQAPTSPTDRQTSD